AADARACPRDPRRTPCCRHGRKLSPSPAAPATHWPATRGAAGDGGGGQDPCFALRAAHLYRLSSLRGLRRRRSTRAAMPSAKRIICVGHAALDRIYRIAAFPAQPTKVRALEHVEVGGGMAANAAVAIARLGGKAELWSRTGDDGAGALIRAGLKSERVDVRYLQAFEGARSSTSAIIVDDGGERLIVGQRDAGMPSGTSWLPLERVKEADAVLGDVRWLEGLRAVFARARA